MLCFRLLFLLLYIKGWSFITREGDGPEDFQTDPPLHPSFFRHDPSYISHIVKVTPIRLLWILRIF